MIRYWPNLWQDHRTVRGGKGRLMIVPIMKKEIHLRLIKRLCTAWFLALVLGLVGVSYLEYKNLDRSLIASAVKESSAFAVLLTSYQEKPDEDYLVEIRRMAGSALEQTSFILVNLLNGSQELLADVALSSAQAASRAFEEKGLTIIPGSSADGVWVIANKRIYNKVAIPVFDSDEDLTGYITGIYLVSLKESQAIINRFAVSYIICSAAITLCALFCYLGFLFLNNHLIRSIGELNRTTIFLVRKLGSALAKSTNQEEGNSSRVLIYAMKLAEKIQLPLDQRRTLIQGVFLHDLGMLPISPATLQKEGELSTEEIKQVDQHPREGAELIKKFRWLKNAEKVIRYHHEKYDGTGYPDGVRHEKIPMVARVFAIADTFDALTTPRPYREPLPLEESLAVLEQETGLQFDPVLLSAFLEIAPHLYETTASKSPRELEKEVDKLLKRYLRYR